MDKHKHKIWNVDSPWEENEKKWDEGAEKAAKAHPLKVLKNFPSMPGITDETAKFLKWKSLKWMLTQDHEGHIRRGILTHPFKYAWRYFKSLLKKKSFIRKHDFFLYGIESILEFEQLLKDPNSIFILGFSYCHKPFECPSGRFSNQCIHDPDNLVCRQCFIGKCVNALPKNGGIPLFIPTVHYIGQKVFEIVHQNPGKKIYFLITACEMTLEMFGDFGNLAGIKGIGIRLDGRICNTMKAFELSEQGIKPGLTVVLDNTQKEMLRLIRLRFSLFQENNYTIS